MSKQSLIGIVAVLVLLIGLFGYITLNPNFTSGSSGSQTPPPPVQYQLDPAKINANWSLLMLAVDGPPFGNPKAPYSLVEIGDFQCPMCGKLHSNVEQLVRDSKGQVKLYFVNYPLVSLHPHAEFAAEAALAATQQGKFWQMYDLLYSHQDELVPSVVQYYSDQDIAGFDQNKYVAALSSPNLKQVIVAQTQLVQSLNVISTPTFFIRSSDTKKVGWFVGSTDSQTSLGFNHLAASPPWLNGGTIPSLQNH